MERERIVTHVITAARHVFDLMLGMEIKPGQDYVEQSTPPADGGVVAVIGLSGTWMGAGTVTCPPQLACKIASTMLMDTYPGVSDEVLDAMAEMANMIFGHVKTEIEGELGWMGLSIPTVVYGQSFVTRNTNLQVWSVIPVQVGEDTLDLRICLSPIPNPPLKDRRLKPRVLELQHEGN